MKALFRLFLGVLILGACSCSGDAPPGDPPPPSFADYYAGELFLAEKTRLEEADSTILAARLDSLRRRHNITARERDSLLSYCQASLPRWESFLKEVLARLESRGKGVAGANGAGGTKGTARTWGVTGTMGVDTGAGKANAVRP